MNDRAQREKLFYDNLGLPYHIAGRYKCPREHDEDMIQAGMLIMWKATETYDTDSGYRFDTYAGKAIEREYERFLGQAYNNSGLSGSSYTRRKAYRAINGDGEIFDGYRALLSTALSTEYTLTQDEDGNATIGDMIESYDDHSELTQSEIKSIVTAALDTLDSQDRWLVEHRFGIGCEPMKQADLGAVYGRTDSWASKHVLDALDRMRGVIPTSARWLLA